MTYSRACIDLVASFEGLKLQAYQDGGGVWTIGRGHTAHVAPGMCCTAEQAQQWLKDDLDRAAKAVASCVSVPVAQHQFDALVSFAFNCRDWQASTLLRLVNQSRFPDAADQFVKWDHIGKKESSGLKRRRLAEAALFRGDFPPHGNPQHQEFI